MIEPQYRHELKYVISQAQIPLLKARIERIMTLDPHVLGQGYYNIRSLYFDDFLNSCYYDIENGTDPREKFRIRIYNHSSDRISLECKRKERGKTLKTACRLTKEQFASLSQTIPAEGNDPLYNKLLLYMRTRLLRPVVIVEYERIPYIYRNGNVRVTFDMNVSSSSPVGGFFEADIPKRPIMPVGAHLLEVKFDEFLPDFIYRTLDLGSLDQTAYSKYYLCRKFTLNGRD